MSVFTNEININELTLDKIHVELVRIPINSSYVDRVLLCAHKIPCSGSPIDLYSVQYDSSMQMFISLLE